MQYINQINTKYYKLFLVFFFKYTRLIFHVRGVGSVKTKVKNQYYFDATTVLNIEYQSKREEHRLFQYHLR